MTAYLLPDGTQVESIDPNTSSLLPGASLTWISHPSLGPIAITVDHLTEVKPPLPPVPDVPAVLIGDQVWARDDIKDEGPVFVLPGGPTLNWEELIGHAEAQRKPIIPLVPDPADAAPALPWTLGDHKDRVAVTDNGLVWIFLEPDYHSPEEARLRAAAILRAAREVEQR